MLILNQIGRQYLFLKISLENTDVSSWSDNHIRSYMTNHLVVERNAEVMDAAVSPVFTIHAVDGRADSHTGAFPYTLEIGKTGNLKKISAFGC